MREQELNPSLEQIKELESSKLSTDQYLGKSLRELFYSGYYRTAFTREIPDPNEPMALQAIRIVGKRNNELQSLTFTMSPDEEGHKRQLKTVFEETKKLPLYPSLAKSFSILEDTALYALESPKLQTIAAMQVSIGVARGNVIVQVDYPRPFMNLLPLPEPYREDLGLGMAIYFLQKVPSH